MARATAADLAAVNLFAWNCFCIGRAISVYILVSLVILLVFLVTLNQFSHLTITNAIKVSRISELGKTTVGFLLLAFSTSLPELSVAVMSGFTNQAGISIGNVIGSNIINICLIIGLAALIMALRRRKPGSMIPSMAKRNWEPYTSVFS